MYCSWRYYKLNIASQGYILGAFVEIITDSSILQKKSHLQYVRKMIYFVVCSIRFTPLFRTVIFEGKKDYV